MFELINSISKRLNAKEIESVRNERARESLVTRESILDFTKITIDHTFESLHKYVLFLFC